MSSAAAVALAARGRDVTPPFDVPSLLVLADGEASAVPSVTVDAARSAGAAVTVIPGAGHSVWYGHLPEFLAALDDWLAGRT
jgi:pimeloyl-ACP methyl ester carboxylesterase